MGTMRTGHDWIARSTGVIRLTGCASLLLAVLLPSETCVAQTSALWGESGELFDPRGRLMDWSYAGYAAGERPLPWRPVSVDVTELGAIPSDGVDDTDAFDAAIAAVAGGGVIAVPEGSFRITREIRLTDGVVLRGAGSGRTTLYFPRSLTDVRGGNPGLESGHSSYMISPGFIRAQGVPQGEVLATVTRNAERGDVTLRVSSTEGISAGQWIVLEQTDVDGQMLERLHADLMVPNTGGHGETWRFRSRVTRVAGDEVELERPLVLDVDVGWSPRIRALSPTTSEVGVEHLTIRFPPTAYPGHFEEQGYNAIELHRVVDSWIRDVRIQNADNGIKVTGSAFVTLADVVLETTESRGDRAGHHGINIANGGDNLIIRFDVRDEFIHDVTTTFYATGTVFADGRGVDLNMDHHSRSPYFTLWTNLHLGRGERPFLSSGSRSFHPHSAAYSTFWNVTADRDMGLPPPDTSGKEFGPRLSFVGFRTNETSGPAGMDWWIEGIPPRSLEPANLWAAMRRSRLGDALRVFSPSPELGNIDHYWRRNPTRWDVSVEDGDARLRLNSSAYRPDGDRLGELAVASTSIHGDFVMEVSAKTAETLAYNPSADYAIIFGYQDPDNYYYLIANTQAQFSQLFIVQDGTRAALATAEAPLIQDEGWHTIEVARTGDEIVVSLDGVERMRATDGTWVEGAIGVGSFNDAAYFDEISIRRPGSPEDAGVASNDGGAMRAGDAGSMSVTDGGSTGPGPGGCGCRAAGSRSGSASIFLGMLGLALAMRRR